MDVVSNVEVWMDKIYMREVTGGRAGCGGCDISETQWGVTDWDGWHDII